MANAPSISGIVDVRCSGILMDYVLAHEPCAPGAAAYARRRMFQYNSLLSQRRAGGCGNGGGILTRNGTSGCHSKGVPYNGSGSIFSGTYGRSALYPDSSHLGYSGSSAGQAVTTPTTTIGYPLEEEEDYTKFDRSRDWITCFGAVVIIACVIGLIHSFAVFAPAIQHHYGTGLVETILVGCLSYFALLITIPIAVCLNRFLENRWTAVFGMVLFFIGLLLDALTVHASTLYISHIIFMGCGGACAYMAAMSIVSDHFRRHLVYAMCAVTCAGSIGTIIFYLLSNLMLSYVSYMWTKLCLALIVLICMGACQTFPRRFTHVHSPGHTDKNKNARLKECVKEAAKDREALARCDEAESPRKSCLCVCVCDISIWTDISFLLWAVISFIAVMTLFIPYLFLVAYAYTVGAEYAVGLVCWFCVASIFARLGTMNSNDHTFGFNRTIFQICCIGSGILYIFLNWADTYGWILVWGLAIGAIEGCICVVIPRVTLQCIPQKWLGSSWRCIGIVHSFSVIVGPMIMMSVYYNTLEYGPALIAIGVAQIIAGILAFLLPNEEANELEDLEDLNARQAAGGGGGSYEPTKKSGPPELHGKSYRNSSYGDGLHTVSQSLGGGYSSRYLGGYSSYSKSYEAGSSGSYARSSTFDSGNFLRGSSNLTSDSNYTDKCPICSKIGCIPGCSGCIPGDLSKSFVETASTMLASKKFGDGGTGLSAQISIGQTSSGYGVTRPKSTSMEDVEQFLSKYNNNNKNNGVSPPPPKLTKTVTLVDRPVTPTSKSSKKDSNKLSPSLHKDADVRPKKGKQSPNTTKSKTNNTVKIKSQRSDKKPVKSK